MKKGLKRILTSMVCALLVAVTLSTSSNAAGDPKKFNNPKHIHGENAIDDMATWSYVYFGSYPMTRVTDANIIAKVNAKLKDNDFHDVTVDGVKYRATRSFGGLCYKFERIKWRVLKYDEKNGTAILMADSAFMCKYFNETDNAITWDKSTIRSYLNGYAASENTAGIDYSKNSFLTEAFSKDERAAICTSTVKNRGNAKYKVLAGQDTKDKIFLPSYEELIDSNYGFCDKDSKESSTRQFAASTYAVEVEGLTKINKGKKESDNVDVAAIMLRTPGKKSNLVATTTEFGKLSLAGDSVKELGYGVIPVLYIDTTKTGVYENVPDSENDAKWYRKGTIHRVGEADYKITKRDDKYGDYEVAYNENYDFKAKSISIPKEVKLGVNTYKVTSISSGVFTKEDKKLVTVTIPSTVTTIEKKAFYGCTGLTTIKGCAGLKTISSCAFLKCKKLKTVPAFSKVKTVGQSAFKDCSALKELKFSKYLTKIGGTAFSGTKKLKLVQIRSTKLTPSNVADGAFGGMSNSTVVKVAQSKLKYYKSFFGAKGLNLKNLKRY